MSGPLQALLVLALVVAVQGVSFWFLFRRKRSKSKGVGFIDQRDDSVSTFNRRRLPRDEPHLWADRIEDWFARLTWHVRFQYVLIGCLFAILMAHIAFS